MSLPTVFMFSGQGSQYFQMGKGLYDADDVFRGWMTRLDEAARPWTGCSVVATLYAEENRKGDRFDRTLLTHPAIFMVEYSLAQCLLRAGIEPDMVLGASLGTFAAAAVAGAMSVEDALRAVVQQAVAFEQSCEPGGMIALLAEPALFAEDFLGGRSELAGVNFAQHFVVSARQRDLAAIGEELERRSINHQRLPVSFPFHSQWIERAKEPFGAFMRSVARTSGEVPIACCDRTTVVSDLSGDYFWDIVRRPIRFRETTARLEAEGPRRYIDLGPSGTLATFLKYGLPRGSRSTIHSILTPFGTDRKNLAALLASYEN